MLPADRAERSEPREANESADAAEQAEPIDSAEQAEPIEPIDPTDPTEPNDPSLAMDRTESREASDQPEATTATLPATSVHAAGTAGNVETEALVDEATLAKTENGLAPEGAGWFVVNARDARWWDSDVFGTSCAFEGDVHFPDFGINIQVLRPGQPNCMYHSENAQEDFLVLSGECLLLVEGEERPLKQWDFVHCPAGTEHVFVGAGSGPCAIVMVGARPDPEELRYPAADVARKHNAGVETTTSSPREAYAPYQHPAEGPYREGTLPRLDG
jgi:uncharacterized cupin superfamily protein